MKLLAILGLLMVPLAARAGVPGGNVYLGVGAAGQLGNAAGGGPSLDLAIELPHLVLGATLGAPLTAHSSSQQFIALARVAYVLSDANHAPYVGLGFGTAHVGGVTLGDGGPGRDFGVLAPEIGMLLFRQNRFGRVNAYAGALVGEAHPSFVAGVRLFL